jgi:Trichohyalin-plectin-homology domain
LGGIVRSATTKFDLRETIKAENASGRTRTDSTAAAAAAARRQYAAIDLAKLEEKAASGAVDADLLTVVMKRREFAPTWGGFALRQHVLQNDPQRRPHFTYPFSFAEDQKPFDVVRKLQRVEDYVVTLDILRSQVANKEMQTQRKLAEEREEAREQTLAMMRDAEEMRKEETKKKDIVKQTKSALLQQLAEREEARAVQEEAEEQEALLLLRTAEEHSKREAAALEAKKKKAREMALQTAEANKVFAIREAERRRKDAEAEEAIVAYEREKLARETAKEEEKAREKKQRELTAAKMMAEAAKLSGKVAEENAARDRRYRDEMWRKTKEQEEAQRRAKEENKREWLATLERQKAEREARKLAEVESEKRYAMEVKANLANSVRKEEELRATKAREKALAGFGPGSGATVAFTRPGPPGDSRPAAAAGGGSSSVISGTSSAVTASGRSRVEVVQERLLAIAEGEAERRVKEGLRAETLARMQARGAPSKLLEQVRTMTL